MTNNKKIGVVQSESVDSNSPQPRTLSEDFRNRKLMWIIFSIILIVLIITIALIIFHVKKTNVGNTLTQQESTIEITITNEPLTTKIIPPQIIRTTRKGQLTPFLPIDLNTKWRRDASTVAGGNGEGNELNQLNGPHSIYIDDDDQSIYISDSLNHRIVKWKFGAEYGEVVAGGNGKGNKPNQLDNPTDAILDKKNNSLIICDRNNERVLRWYPGNDRYEQIMFANIGCWGLTMDNNEDLYISDREKHVVTGWEQGNTNGRIVAGGCGGGSNLNQLMGPHYIFVDEDYSVYVAEFFNARVTKWVKDAKEGILVASKEVSEDNPDYPHRISAVIVDHIGTIYMSDMWRCKVTRWLPDAREGTTAVGGECGPKMNHLLSANDLSFDRQGNLYVVDTGNHRVQKFAIQLD